MATAFVVCLLAAALRGQEAPRSALTGATLIPGTKLDKGFFVRMAAKASMDLNAQDVGQLLTDDYEVHKLPPALGLNAVGAMQAALEGQGWRLTYETTKTPESEKWGWMFRPETPARRYLVFFLLDKKQSYLYLGQAAGPSGQSAPPPSAPPPYSAPPPGPIVATAPGASTTPTASSVSIYGPSSTPPPAAPPRSSPPPPSRAPVGANPGGWAFTSSTFTDGWTSYDERDWVRAVKGSVTARVHHATFDLTRFVNQDGTIHVWNQLIVPRYRDLTQVWVRKPWWEDGDKNYVSAEGTEIASGKRYYLILFRNGNGKNWIEYLAPDKATFEREMNFAVQVQGGTNWGAIIYDGLNKFAVGPNDLPGKWGSSSAAGVEYVSALSGNSLGIGAVSSNYDFTFQPDGTYTMRYAGASGMAGRQTFGGENWAGNVILSTPWKMSLTGTFRGQTYDFDVWFEAVGGGARVLVLRRHDYDIRLLRSSR